MEKLSNWEKCAFSHLLGIIFLAICFSYLNLSEIPMGTYHYIVSALAGVFSASLLSFIKKEIPYFPKNKTIKFIYSFCLKFLWCWMLVWATFKIVNDFPNGKLMFIGYCSFWFWLANILTSELISNQTKLNHEESKFLLQFIKQYRNSFVEDFHAKNGKLCKSNEGEKEYKILCSVEDKILCDLIDSGKE